jgi:hypothetical protein
MPRNLRADTFLPTINAEHHCSWTFLVYELWTQGSDRACFNLMFISHIRDADNSIFSIDRDLWLSTISEGREIHVVFTEVTIITPRISLLLSFSCFNSFTVVRVLRQRSLHLCESVGQFRFAFTLLPICL